jgi:hypothetical protein
MAKEKSGAGSESRLWSKIYISCSQEAACFVKNSLIFAALFLGWVATIMHHQNKQPD